MFATRVKIVDFDNDTIDNIFSFFIKEFINLDFVNFPPKNTP